MSVAAMIAVASHGSNNIYVVYIYIVTVKWYFVYEFLLLLFTLFGSALLGDVAAAFLFCFVLRQN